MGRQIEFYMDKNMEKNFERLILEKGCISIINKYKKFQIVNELPKYKTNTCIEWREIFLFLKDYSITITNTENGIQYINVLDEETIQYSRSYKKDDIFTQDNSKVISNGRIYATFSTFDVNNELVHKSSEFLKWYESLTRWIKKNCPMTEYVQYNETYKDYMSPEIKRLVDEEGYILG